MPAAAVLLLGSLRLENIVESAHFLLHQSLDVGLLSTLLLKLYLWISVTLLQRLSSFLRTLQIFMFRWGRPPCQSIGMQGKLLVLTGFGTGKMLCMLIGNYAILAIVPNSGRHAQC